MTTNTQASRREKTLTPAKLKFLKLLSSGGTATSERGYGPIVFGSDGYNYSSATVGALERAMLVKLEWNIDSSRWQWKLTPKGIEECSSFK